MAKKRCDSSKWVLKIEVVFTSWDCLVIMWLMKCKGKLASGSSLCLQRGLGNKNYSKLYEGTALASCVSSYP